MFRCVEQKLGTHSDATNHQEQAGNSPPWDLQEKPHVSTWSWDHQTQLNDFGRLDVGAAEPLLKVGVLFNEEFKINRYPFNYIL